MIHSGPLSHLFKLTSGERLVPKITPEAFCLCAHEKGRGLSIKGELCKRVYEVNDTPVTRLQRLKGRTHREYRRKLSSK